MNRKILPPTYFYLFIILSVFLHFLIPVKQIFYYPWSLIGILPIVFGIVLNIWTDKQFSKKNTTVKPFGKPTSLLVSGPFKISRHPMYLGMTLILLGISIFLGSAILFIFPVLFFVLMNFLFIKYEEKNMEKIFTDGYREYKKKVRRWI